MNVIVMLSLVLAGSLPLPEISGTLLDDRGKPASGVVVSAVQIVSNQAVSTTRSLKDGSFSFAGIASGAYGIVAKTNGACAISNAIKISPGYTSFVHLRLVDGMCANAIAPVR